MLSKAKNLKRFFSTVRRPRKPVDPEAAKSLPIFDYGKSSPDYQRIFVWGNIQTGALGVPYMRGKDKTIEIEAMHQPKRLGFAEKLKVKTVGCGFGFTAFAVDDPSTEYKLFGTGLNTDSQIGYHAIRKDHPMEIIYFPQPIGLPFKNPENAKIIKLKGGRAHLVVLTKDEGIFLLGNNAYGQCGRPIVENENYFMSNYINHIPEIDSKKIIDIECGQDHTLALTEDGSVYSCGWGADGQTGLGVYESADEFRKVKGDIEGEKIVKVSSRSDFVLALNEKGQVFGWGNTEYRQIETENHDQQVSNPTYLKNLEHLIITDVAAGGTFCVVLDKKGRVHVWGYGILGAGPNVDSSNIPIQLPETLFGKNDIQPDCKVVSVTCGLSSVFAVTNSDSLYSWGRNSYGSLGLGSGNQKDKNKDQFFPFRVGIGGYVKELSCGADHTVAICKPFI